MKSERLKSGNYRCKVYLGTVNGKKVWKSVTGPSKKKVEADAARLALMYRADAGETVAGAVNRFILAREATISPSTVRGYRGIERRMTDRFPALMAMPLQTVETADLQRVVDALSKTSSPKTVANEVIFVCTALRHAGCVIQNPNLPQRVKPTYHIPSESTVKEILLAARGTQLEVPIMLAAFGPLRRGEICALSMEDIRGNTIHVKHDMVRNAEGKWVIKPPKTLSSDRVIVMPAEVINLIHERGLYKGTPNSLYQAWTRFLARNGFPRYRLHDLRHWSASYMHGLGVPDEYIRQRTGHADYSTLRNIYTHTLQDQSEAETARILGAFSALGVETFVETTPPKCGISVPNLGIDEQF